MTHALAARTFGDFATILSDLPIDLPDDAQLATLAANPDGSDPNAAPRRHEGWSMAGPPIGMILMLVGIVAMVVLLLGGPSWHLGPMPFWSFIWIFFFFGWPRGGRRRHF